MPRCAVLLVANNFPPVRGGSAQVYGSLARHLGPRMHVLAPQLNYVSGSSLVGVQDHDAGCPCAITRIRLLRTMLQPLPHSRLRLVSADLRIRAAILLILARLLLRLRPRAVCIGELLASGWIAAVLCHVPGLRTVIYVHGEEITTEEAHDPAGARRRHTLRAARHVVVVSRFTEQRVLALIGDARPGQVVRIENGVDRARFTPGPRDPALVAHYGFAGCFVFVSVCRLVEKKGIDTALRAFARHHAAHPDTRYLVVGEGAAAPSLHALTASLHLEAAVRFAGDVQDSALAAHYRLGDVFLMPNRTLPNGDTEGFGLVFLEANGCGLPVIAGKDGGSTDAVQDGVNGLVVDGASVDAVEAAMTMLHQDAGLRTRLTEGGLAAAAASGWESKAAQLLRLCETGKP